MASRGRHWRFRSLIVCLPMKQINQLFSWFGDLSNNVQTILWFEYVAFILWRSFCECVFRWAGLRPHFAGREADTSKQVYSWPNIVYVCASLSSASTSQKTALIEPETQIYFSPFFVRFVHTAVVFDIPPSSLAQSDNWQAPPPPPHNAPQTLNSSDSHLHVHSF